MTQWLIAFFCLLGAPMGYCQTLPATDAAKPQAGNAIQTAVVSDISPKRFQAGTAITLTGTNLPTDEASVELRFCPGKATTCGEDKIKASFVQRSDTSITLRTPPTIPTGSYTILVTLNRQDQPFPFTGYQVMPPPPKIDTILPAVSFAGSSNDIGSAYVLRVRGSGFSEKPNENVLRLMDLAKCPTESDPNRACAFTSQPGATATEIAFAIPAAYGGKHDIQISVTDSLPSDVKQVRLSPMATHWPYIITVAVLIALIVLVLCLASQVKLAPGAHPIALSWGRRLLLETSTNTFSLAKAQFYAWTFAVVAAYIYFILSRLFVQGALAWADVPSNLPIVFLVSAATSVTSAGVDTATGGKGSGEYLPSISDFITSGGTVAPERLQFLIWTIIGSLGFLLYTFSYTPDEITGLPSVPQSVIELMGISSLGYVGGKIARGPGPQVTSITGTELAGFLDIIVSGTALSTKGARYTLSEGTVDNPGQEVTIPTEAIRQPPDSTIDTSGYATKLSMHVPAIAPLAFNAAPAPPAVRLTRNFIFTIVNPDGEKAVWPFTV